VLGTPQYAKYARTIMNLRAIALVTPVVLAVAACTLNKPIDRSSFNLDVCPAGAKTYSDYNPIAEVAFAQNDIYVGLIKRSGDKLVAVPSLGEPCLDAPDKTACKTAVGEVSKQPGNWKVVTECPKGTTCELTNYLLFRERKGDVKVMETAADLRDLIGVIDSPAKAALLASFRTNGVYIGCSGPQVRKRADNGYDVFLELNAACGGRSEGVVAISAKGDNTAGEVYVNAPAGCL
jgi:hypothetical protein